MLRYQLVNPSVLMKLNPLCLHATGFSWFESLIDRFKLCEAQKAARHGLRSLDS